MTRELEPINTKIADNVMKKLNNIKTSFYEFKNNFRFDIITTHVQNVQSILTATTILIIVDLPFASIFVLAVFFIHYQLGLILLFFIFIPFLVNILYSNKIYESINKTTLASINSARVYDNISSRNSTVKYYNLFGLISKTWNVILSQFIFLREKGESNKNLLQSSLNLISSLLTVAIIAWGATLAVSGQISVGALIGANILASRAIMPILKFIQTIEPLKKAEDSLNEIKKIFQISEEKHEGSIIKDFEGRLSLNDLYFRYPETKNPIFESLSCTVGSGDMVVIKGSNGSGKTTLIKTLAGILEFERGNIFYDDIEISQLSLPWIRQNITYLPQEPEFLDGTLLHNIIGSTEISEDSVKEIIKRSDLSYFINNHPDGINMTMVDRGLKLPVGIRKRIALARSLRVNGGLFLFDEPTSDLDERGKETIYQLINEIKMSKLTIFVATADENIIKQANIIINLDSKPKPEIIKDNVKYKIK